MKDNYVHYQCQKVGEVVTKEDGFTLVRRVNASDLTPLYRGQLLWAKQKDELILEVNQMLNGLPTTGPGSDLWELREKVKEMANLMEQGRA